MLTGFTNDFNDLQREGSERAHHIYSALREKGVDFASGVPCGVLRHLIYYFENDLSIRHLGATRESEAVGLVAGACLAGCRPVVYMQNSGFFSASNEIASLLIPYELPVLFIVSYRGCEGEDAVQHLATGAATEDLIGALGLRCEVFSTQDLRTLVGNMILELRHKRRPAVLLLKRGWHND